MTDEQGFADRAQRCGVIPGLDGRRHTACGGRVALADAQRQMQVNWFAFGEQLGALG